jgi:hypothetical protein
VGQAKGAPDDDILILDVVASRCCIADSLRFFCALQCEAAAGVELVVLVLRHPEVVLGELGTLGLYTVGICKQQLRRRWHDLVSHRRAADRVKLVSVLDLEDAMSLRVCIDTFRGSDGCLDYLVVVAHRVGLRVHGHRQALFLDHRVLVAVYGRVDSHTEDVLVVLCQGARADDLAVVALLSLVDVHHGDDASGSDLNSDGAGLVEDVVESVLVVCQCNDELEDEFTPPRHHCTASPPVCVLPTNAVILLMQTHDVLGNHSGSVRAGRNSIEILILF